MTIKLLHCNNSKEILSNLRTELQNYRDNFPRNTNIKIIIKPNLNSNLDALTGNTTDLRVLTSLLTILKEYEYSNIHILEGPNGGFHRDGINVFKRNGLDRLASYYGCTYSDVNYENKTFDIEFEGSGITQIANRFNECDLFINVPKLKTHYETLISVALKSLIGTLVGQQNKAKAHASLYENILRINDKLHPQLQIVDGMVAMEGTGPSAGIPVLMNKLIVGDNPYEIDILSAGLMGFKAEDCPLINHALNTQRIDQKLIIETEKILSNEYIRLFKKPNPSILAKMVVLPGFNQIVRKIRNWDPINNLLKLEQMRRIMFLLGLTQEVIVAHEKDVCTIWNEKKCKICGKCSSYCPQMLNLPNAFNDTDKKNNCLNCLYCFSVCPEDAITLKGEVGYFKEQIRRYQKIIKQRL